MIYLILFLALWYFISKNYNSWITDYEIWKLKNKKEYKKVKSYKSVEVMLDELKEEPPFFQRILRKIKWIITDFLDIPYDIEHWIITKYQRAKRGWSDSDAWGFNDYLAKVIIEGCKWLKENKHGCPSLEGFENIHNNEKMFDEMCKEWDKILDNIIWTFEMELNNNLFYQDSKNYSEQEAKKYNNMWIDWKYKPKPRAMTLEECQKFDKGWEYFKKYFRNLWD